MRSKLLRIGIIHPRISYYVGGAEKIAARFIYESIARNKTAQFLLITVKPDGNLIKPSHIYKELKQIKDKRLQIIEISMPKSLMWLYEKNQKIDQNRYDIESFWFNRASFPYLLKEKPQILISYYLNDGVFRPTDIPGIIYLLGTPSNIEPIRISLLKQFNKIFCISSAVKYSWPQQLDLDKNKLEVLLSPFTDQKLLGSERPLSMDENKVNIVFAGRLIERKGVDVLIEAVSELSKLREDIVLHVIGEGEERSNLEKKCGILGIKNLVKFYGVLDNPTAYFKYSSVCVFPSQAKEGLMGVVVESLAAGALVIGSEGMGNEEVINSGENGFLIPPNNKVLLAETIDKVLSLEDPIKKQISIKAKKVIKEKLDFDKHFDIIYKACTELLS